MNKIDNKDNNLYHKIDMSQLSKYIQKELITLLDKIHQTPPKRCASMNKIKALVCQAPLTIHEKGDINKSIRKIQNAMVLGNFERKKSAKSQYVKNLFYENMFLQEKNINKAPTRQQPEQNEGSAYYTELMLKLQQVRGTRLKREQYLNDLILKTQRMERLVALRQQNQQKYLRSKMLESEHQAKKTTKQQIERSVKQAARNNKVKSVYNLVSKYNNFMK